MDIYVKEKNDNPCRPKVTCFHRFCIAKRLISPYAIDILSSNENKEIISQASLSDVQGRVVQSLTKLIQDYQEFGFQFCNFSVLSLI